MESKPEGNLEYREIGRDRIGEGKLCIVAKKKIIIQMFRKAIKNFAIDLSLRKTILFFSVFIQDLFYQICKSVVSVSDN